MKLLSIIVLSAACMVPSVWYNWSGNMLALYTGWTSNSSRVESTGVGTLGIFDVHYDPTETHETTKIVWYTKGGSYTSKADIYTYVADGLGSPSVLLHAYPNVNILSETVGAIVRHTTVEPVLLPFGHDYIWIGIRNLTTSGGCDMIAPIEDMEDNVGYTDWISASTNLDGTHNGQLGLQPGQCAVIVEYE